MKLDRSTLLDVHKSIADTVNETFSKCEFTLSDASKMYVTNSFFGALSLNGDDDKFVSHELAKTNVKLLFASDLGLLRQLFVASMMEDELEEEIRRRG